MRFTAYEYQKRAIRWVTEHKRCCLFLDMGLGKSVCTLTAASQLMDWCEVTRTLVVAPKKVAETTWTDEAAKWDHLRHLRVSRVMGTQKQRVQALGEDADIYVIGRDSFAWLVDYYDRKPPFDMLVIDELTSFKSPKSLRFKAMRAVSPVFSRVVGLTGTPAPNGLEDLWAQLYCVDLGERLGRFVTRYREAYFTEYRWNNIVVRRTPKKGAEEAIRSRISDICLTMQAKDYLELPPMITHDERVILSQPVMDGYKSFERDRVMEFSKDTDGKPSNIIAQSAAGLMNKLSQYAAGSVYDSDGNPVAIHREKVERLAELVEQAGSPVLVFYQFRHDIPVIIDALKGRKVVEYKDSAQLAEWNSGKIDVLLAHPASTAFGLNMQAGGHYIVWFGTGWNLELYQQANARLHRQGQQHPVIVYRLVCAGTVDELALSAIDRKKGVQQALLDGLKELKDSYGLEEGKESL